VPSSTTGTPPSDTTGTGPTAAPRAQATWPVSATGQAYQAAQVGERYQGVTTPTAIHPTTQPSPDATPASETRSPPAHPPAFPRPQHGLLLAGIGAALAIARRLLPEKRREPML
jgi:hypothetical protein